MTTGPENPYGQPSEPTQPIPPASPTPPSPGPVYGQQPPAYGQQPPAAPYGYQQPYTQPYPPAYTPAPPNEGMAVAAMVVGIVSLVLACGYGIGLLGSPVALALGRTSMKRIDNSNGTLGGRGMAQAGFILGIIGTALLAIAIVILVIVIIAAANGAFDTTYDY